MEQVQLHKRMCRDKRFVLQDGLIIIILSSPRGVKNGRSKEEEQRSFRDQLSPLKPKRAKTYLDTSTRNFKNKIQNLNFMTQFF